MEDPETKKGKLWLYKREETMDAIQQGEREIM